MKVSQLPAAGTLDGAEALLVSQRGSSAKVLLSAIGSFFSSWFQARDADLDALAALNGTGVLYYRSAANTWSAVTYGPNLSFANGQLTVPGLANYAPLAGATFTGAVNVPFIRAGDPSGPRAILEADGATAYITGYNNAVGTFNPILVRGSRVAFGIGSGENLTILPNGNVGIGTTTPGAKLQVAGPVLAVRFCYTATVCDYAGTGTPLGNVAAGVGSTYRRTDGGAGTTFYVKESGTDASGWVAK